MKVNELMIGDWVCLPSIMSDDKYPVQVLEIQDDCIKYYSGGKKMMVRFKHVEPIPITPEILEKNGFKRDPLWHHCDKDLDNYSISVQLGYANRIEYIKIAEKGKDNVIPSERTKLYLTHIKYVHELQHLLRLCRINKIIEL